MRYLTNHQLAFFLARITAGINFFMHGIVRLPKLQSFAEKMASGFEDTYMPLSVVKPYALALPIIELIIGIFLLVGFKTRLSAAAGFLLIAILILGASVKEDWALVGSQMVYAIFFFLLIKNLEYNALSIDSRDNNSRDNKKESRISHF